MKKGQRTKKPVKPHVEKRWAVREINEGNESLLERTYTSQAEAEKEAKWSGQKFGLAGLAYRVVRVEIKEIP